MQSQLNSGQARGQHCRRTAAGHHRLGLPRRHPRSVLRVPSFLSRSAHAFRLSPLPDAGRARRRVALPEQCAKLRARLGNEADTDSGGVESASISVTYQRRRPETPYVFGSLVCRLSSCCVQLARARRGRFALISALRGRRLHLVTSSLELDHYPNGNCTACGIPTSPKAEAGRYKSLRSRLVECDKASLSNLNDKMPCNPSRSAMEGRVYVPSLKPMLGLARTHSACSQSDDGRRVPTTVASARLPLQTLVDMMLASRAVGTMFVPVGRSLLSPSAPPDVTR